MLTEASGADGVNVADLMNAEPKAVFEAFKLGVEQVSGILEGK